MSGILVGVSSHGSAKDYVHKKFKENMLKCVQPWADIIVFGDREIDGLDHIYMDPIHSCWQDDMTYESREEIRKFAADNDYDAFIWQGVDCLYHSEDDFRQFCRAAHLSEFDAIGALTAGRNRPDYAVARRFIGNTKEQVDISTHELNSSKIIPAGFPGADALLVRKSMFLESWMKWDYISWYNQRDIEQNPLCIEEYWCWKTSNSGFTIGLDTGIRTWHVHENGMAARWPGEYTHQDNLCF